jgi:hypothetical protein
MKLTFSIITQTATEISYALLSNSYKMTVTEALFFKAISRIMLQNTLFTIKYNIEV